MGKCRNGPQLGAERGKVEAALKETPEMGARESLPERGEVYVLNASQALHKGDGFQRKWQGDDHQESG